MRIEDEEIQIDFDEEMPHLKPSLVVSALITMIMMIGLYIGLSSCTLSLQTINTSGTATDLVDDEQKADSEFTPQVSLPISGV